MGAEHHLKNVPISNQMTPTGHCSYTQGKYELEAKTDGRSVLVRRQFHRCKQKRNIFVFFFKLVCNTFSILKYFPLLKRNSTEHEADHIRATHINCDQETQNSVKIIVVYETTSNSKDHLKCSRGYQHFPSSVPNGRTDGRTRKAARIWKARQCHVKSEKETNR